MIQMNKIIIIFIFAFSFKLSQAWADDIQPATKDDLREFDQMLAQDKNFKPVDPARKNDFKKNPDKLLPRDQFLKQRTDENGRPPRNDMNQRPPPGAGTHGDSSQLPPPPQHPPERPPKH